MNKSFIVCSFLMIVNSGLMKSEDSFKKKKNIIFIVADDLGWSDVGYENDEIISPNINYLAKNGIILNQAYTYSTCTPSRNSILSGVYAEKTGLQHNVIFPQQPIGIPTSFKLMPQVFKELGYQTHIVGKWHLGFCNLDYTPVNRGFDSFYGFFNAQEDYYTHRVPELLDRGDTVGLDYWNQTRDYLVPILDKNGTYSTFSFTDRAIDIINSVDKNKPFFLYFASQNVHLPNQVPEEYEKKYMNIKNEERRKYLGMITLLDESIGKIYQRLKDLNLIDDTLIAFTSDNGGATYTAGRNYPLRGGKFTAFEGGHRVRAFINGKNLKPYTNQEFFHAVDWLPTLVNAATENLIDIKGIDGIDQWPFLIDDLPSNRTSFIYNIDPFGEYGCSIGTNAIREGDWKFIKGCPGIFDDWYPLPDFDTQYINSNKIKKSDKYLINNDAYYLFNIKDDPYEINNLAKDNPDLVKKLNAKLKEYKKSVQRPLNPPSLKPDHNADPSNWGDKWSPGWCS